MSFIFQLVGLPFAVIGGSISLAHDGMGLAVQSVKDRRQRRKISSQAHQARRARGSRTQSPHCGKGCDCAISPTAQDLAKDSPPPYAEAIAQLPAQAEALPWTDQTSSPISGRLRKPRGGEKRRMSLENGGFDAHGSLLYAA